MKKNLFKDAIYFKYFYIMKFINKYILNIQIKKYIYTFSKIKFELNIYLLIFDTISFFV